VQYQSDYGARTPLPPAALALGSGSLDAARVFIMGANPSAPTDNQKVRVELRLK
jgi:hypothetical protein